MSCVLAGVTSIGACVYRELFSASLEVEESDIAFAFHSDQGALLLQEGASGGKTKVISVPLPFPVLMFNENVS